MGGVVQRVQDYAPVAGEKPVNFSRKTAEGSSFEPRNGKRNRREKLCVHGHLRAPGGNDIMNGAKKTFLLPCGGCQRDIDVVAGQAGDRVECPSCGQWNDVPKFRDLSQLQIKPQADRSRPRDWGLPQAVALAGVACAVLAWGMAAVVGSTPKAALDTAVIRANIDAGDDAALYRSLQEYAQATVDRGPVLIEVDLQRRTLFAQRVSRALFVIGGLGALAAAGAGCAVLASAKRV